MTDLYAALNVAKDANAAEVHAAYRKAAKSAHPDAGGTRDKFALVKLARDTLTNEPRRAKYDKTGEVEENPIDQGRAQVLEMLSAGLDIALAKLYDRAKPPIQSDMSRLTKEAIGEMRRKWTDERSELRKNVERSQELSGRWSAKGENVMEMIVAHRVKYLQTCIASLDQRIECSDRALGMLDSASFRFDVVREQSPTERWIAGGMQSVNMLEMMKGSRW